jgi:hypothetical protein
MMNEIKITTNNIPRPILYGYELTPAERAEFDYYNEDELDCAMFFRYKGEVYDIGEFMRVPKYNPFPDAWAGYMSDSYFSGILIRFPDDDDDYVIVGRYCS